MNKNTHLNRLFCSKEQFFAYALAFLFCFASASQAQDWNTIIKRTATDRAKTSALARSANDWYGFSVDIDGDIAVVGTPYESGDPSDNTLMGSGAAYILRNVGGIWTQRQKLVGNVRGAGYNFGLSVAILGDYIVVGAPSEKVGDLVQGGAVYIYHRKQCCENSWSLQKKLLVPSTTSATRFGWSLAISGDYLVVGAHTEQEDENNANIVSSAGAAYVYYRQQGGENNWGLQKKLVSPTRAANDWFGYSVAISGDNIVIGARYEDAEGGGTNAGAVYVFSRHQGGENKWGLQKKLTATIRDGMDEFGIAVAISGDDIVVTSHQDSHDANDGDFMPQAGSAYLFSRDQGGANNWGLRKKLTASPRTPAEFFGVSVDILGDYIAIGAKRTATDENGANYKNGAGAVYVFSRNQGGENNWGQQKKIVAPIRGSQDEFGFSVALSANRLLVGVPNEDDDTKELNYMPEAGAAYLYKLDNANGWAFEKKLVTWDTQQNASFGYAVAIDGNIAAVGALGDVGAGDEPKLTAGSVYILENIGGNWTEIKRIANPNLEASHLFGIFVEVSGDYMVVSSDWYVYVYYRHQGGQNTWALQKTISVGTFLVDVAFSGDYLVVGASAYIRVYHRNQGGENNWGQQKDLPVPMALSYSWKDYSIAISNNFVAVGGKTESLDATDANPLHAAGRVFLYARQQGGENNWGLQKIITAPVRASGDYFGYAVSLLDDMLAVGADREKDDENEANAMNEAGAVYLFQRNQGGVDNWGFKKKVVSTNRQISARFGGTVVLAKDFLLVGARYEDKDATASDAGAAYVFRRNEGGADNWGFFRRIVAPMRSKNDVLGSGLDASDDYILVGAGGEDEDDNEQNAIDGAGCVYFVSRSNTLPSPASSLDFRAVRAGESGTVNLSWTAVFESQSKGFEVEISTDGQNFRSLGFVDSKGSTSVRNSYEFSTVFLDDAHYRLRQVSLDGNIACSTIAFVSGVFKVYPNPNNGNFTAKGDGEASLIDMTGREVWTGKTGEIRVALPAGVYILRTTTNGSTRYTKIIVRQ